MKNTSSIFLSILVLFLFSSCIKRKVEEDFQSGLPLDLSNIKIDFSGLDIDFELLFEYEDKDALLTEAENMFPDMLMEAKVLINKKDDMSHVLFSFKIANGKATIQELLMYDSLHQTVKDYHNYTKKLGAVDGVSPNEQLLNTAFNEKAPETYEQIEQFESASKEEEQTKVFVNYLNTNYHSISDEMDFILVVGNNRVRAYVD